MTLEELEAKMVLAGVTSAAAKMIATMALDPSIERHDRAWAISVRRVVVSTATLSAQKAQQRDDALRAIIGTVIKEHSGIRRVEFMPITDLIMARGNEYLSYRFSQEFFHWAGLTQNESDKLH